MAAIGLVLCLLLTAGAAAAATEEIPLHIQLVTSQPVRLADLSATPTKVRVGDSVAFSARLTERMTGFPISGAMLYLILAYDHEQASPFTQPSAAKTPTLSELRTLVKTNSQGYAEAEVPVASSKFGVVLPGCYVAKVSGPERGYLPGQAGPTYERTVSHCALIEVWDKAIIGLRVVTGDDHVTTIKGTVGTTQGLGLAVPVDLALDGRPCATVQADDEGRFTWSTDDLPPGLHSVKATCDALPFVDAGELTVTHDPTLIYWDVSLWAPGKEVTLSGKPPLLEVRVDGDLWPPDLLVLVIEARGATGEPAPVGSLTVTEHVALLGLTAPPAPGSYTLTAKVADAGGRHRITSNELALSFLGVTTLQLRSVKTVGAGGATSLEGRLTFLGQPLPDQSWEVTRDGQPLASGLTNASGEFTVRGPDGSPLDPGSYQARFVPAEDSDYLPSLSPLVRLGLPSWPVFAAGATLLVGVFAGAVWLSRRLAARAGVQLQAPQVELVEAVPETSAPPTVDPSRLSPREQVLYAYESVALGALAALAVPDSTRGQRDFWCRVSRALPEVRTPLGKLLDLYLEAGYSEHSVTDDQVREAWRLARDITALVDQATAAGENDSSPLASVPAGGAMGVGVTGG